MTTLPKPSNPASGLTCKWDAWNHLVEAKDGATVVAKYECDELARRTKKHVDSRSKIQQVPTGSTPMCTFSTTAAGKCSKSATARWKTRSPESLQPKYQFVWSQRNDRRGHLARRQHRQSLRVTRVFTTWATPTSTSPHWSTRPATPSSDTSTAPTASSPPTTPPGPIFALARSTMTSILIQVEGWIKRPGFISTGTEFIALGWEGFC